MRQLLRGTAAKFLVSAVLVPMSTGSVARADGDYTISWHSLQAGGVASSPAGEYHLSGAIGQPDSGSPVVSGDYVLDSGFWVPFGGETSGLPEVGQAAPREFVVRSPAPNPFHSWTEFAIDVPKSGRLIVAVFSVDGREIRSVVDREVGAGQVRARWDGRNDAGRPIGPGVFFVRTRLGTEERSFRVVRVDR